MQGIWEKNSNGDRRELLRVWRMEIAVVFAVLSHLVLILLPGFSIEKSSFNPTVFNIQLQEKALVEESEEKITDQSTLEEDVIEEKSADKPIKPKPNLTKKQVKPKKTKIKLSILITISLFHKTNNDEDKILKHKKKSTKLIINPLC